MKMKNMLLLILCVLVAAVSPVLAAEAPMVPATIEGVQNVSAAQVKESIAAGAKVYDVRPERAHVKGKIPGTDLLTYDEKSPKQAQFDATADSFDVNSLPKDKNAEVVFYCNGDTCWKSYKASLVAQKAGYKNIKWFRGGLPEWEGNGLPVVKP